MAETPAVSSVSPPPTWWRFSPRRSLAARLGLLALGGVVALTLLVAYLAGRYLGPELESRTGEQLQSDAVQVAAMFEGDVTETRLEAQNLAARMTLWSEGAHVEDRREALDELETRLELAWIGFANAAGVVVAAPDAVREGEDVSQQDWFKKGWTGAYLGVPQEVSALDEAIGPGLRYLPMAVPVVGADGVPVGVIGVLRHWSFNTRRSPLPASAAKQGIVATLYSAAAGNAWLLQSSGDAAPKQTKAPVETTGPRGYGREELDGVEYLSGYALSEGKGNWMVAVRQPLTAVLAPIQGVQLRILGWGLGLGFLLALRIWIVTERHAHGLRRIGASAERIDAGDSLSVLPTFAGDDELARTGASLRELVEKLRRRG